MGSGRYSVEGIEWNAYPDKGCKWHPSCLKCPEKDCLYEHPERLKKGRPPIVERDLEIVKGK